MRLRKALTAALVTGFAATTMWSAPASAGVGSIGGTAFDDANRNGTRDAGEAAFADHQVYLFDTSDRYYGTTVTDSGGTYRFSDVPTGEFVVQYATGSWNTMRSDWTPTTTASLRPIKRVSVSGPTTADFGWRRIVRSTDANAPISRFVGPNGLTAESFNDVVHAKDVYDSVMRGFVGAEAPSVVVRLDLGPGSSTATSVGQTTSGYVNYRAITTTSWVNWLETGDMIVAHEYGHAWSLYHAYMTQQDPSLSGYLQARGLAGDSRVGSTYSWYPQEMIADDYRQLLGPEGVRGAQHLNWEIPPAWEVPGLADYLRTVFTTAPSTNDPQPEPAPEPEPAPTPEPAPEPEPEAPLAISDLRMSPTPVRASGTVGFTLTDHAHISVSIRDAKGAVVRTLAADVAVDGGALSFAWDRKDDRGRKVKSGTYSLRVDAVEGAQVVSETATFKAA